MPGGLIRSMGGIAKLLLLAGEQREAADERILVGWLCRVGAGNVRICQGLRNCFPLGNEVANQAGVNPAEIVGPSRGHVISKARRKFYLYAHEKAGASLATLGKMTGRTHVAVLLAIEEAKKERKDW